MFAFEDTPFMALAAAEAEKFIGATAPNPPVGACLVKNGQLLSVGAHELAGTDHAEVVAIKRALERHGSDALRGATLYVTLEPCNHFGKTPPCTQAIIETGITRVVFGVADPNPNVAGGGRRALEEAGIETVVLDENTECSRLIAPFQKWSTTSSPWVVHKLAFRLTPEHTLTMLPKEGFNTFTTPESLKIAHMERKKSDAILTTLPTVLADLPLFNVRHVQDHAAKKRILAVVTKTPEEIPQDWIKRQTEFNFEILTASSAAEALGELGKRGAHRVLVEAGPTFSEALIRNRLWDEKLTFIHTGEAPDFISREYLSCSPES